MERGNFDAFDADFGRAGEGFTFPLTPGMCFAKENLESFDVTSPVLDLLTRVCGVGVARSEKFPKISFL